MSSNNIFSEPSSKDDLEKGLLFTPKFDEHGLIPAIATDAETGEVLMFAFMNEEALAETINTRQATYWSRSRQALWRKGETSGNVQRVIEIRTDCDQDAIWMRVRTEGHDAACHLGFRSCFHRAIPEGTQAGKNVALEKRETAPRFDPKEVYEDK